MNGRQLLNTTRFSSRGETSAYLIERVFFSCGVSLGSGGGNTLLSKLLNQEALLNQHPYIPFQDVTIINVVSFDSMIPTILINVVPSIGAHFFLTWEALLCEYSLSSSRLSISLLWRVKF